MPDDNITLLDGAMGTELERRGVDAPLPLWSAAALINTPEEVEQIHLDYLNAGADTVTTCTFRTHRRSLAKAGFGDRARELTHLAVEIARSARDRVRPEALLLGGIAPLEDCYQPELCPSDEECRAEHAEIISHLLEADVDLILIETQNTAREAIAAAEVAHRLAPGRWIMSFIMKTDGPPGTLLHGAPMVDVLPVLKSAYAIGVNCMHAPAIASQLRLFRTLLPDSVRLVAYGNSGHVDETGHWSEREQVPAEIFARHAMDWVDAGATMIGGCCGTTPATIHAIARALGRRPGAPTPSVAY